ncbi:universal stress protein [Streptomyces sp. NPDC086033]|uniref:universal stress protein n=1 Tax=Streptomyces sp. NPDC086033 TaxID=3365747 RepID=UPI0037D28211
MAIPLVVGIDGSESSLEAADLAAAETARHSLSLHFVHAAAGDREPSDVISAGRNALTLVPGYRDARASPQVPGAPSVAGRGVG